MQQGLAFVPSESGFRNGLWFYTRFWPGRRGSPCVVLHFPCPFVALPLACCCRATCMFAWAFRSINTCVISLSFTQPYHSLQPEGGQACCIWCGAGDETERTLFVYDFNSSRHLGSRVGTCFSRNSMDGRKQFKGWFTQDGWKKRSNGVLKCGCLFLWCGEYNQESEWRCHQFSSVSFLGSLD